jgi:hypothetical protein
MAFTDDTDSREFGGSVATTDVGALQGILTDPAIVPLPEPSPGESRDSEEEQAALGQSTPIPELKAYLIGRADRMGAMVDWTGDEFLEYAGCAGRSTPLPEDLQKYLLSCVSYFSWVEKMLDKLDLQFDRRLVVLGSTQLYSDAGRKLFECERVMEAGDPPAANQLLGLGEVTRAFQTARGHLHTPAGQRTRQILLEDPDYAHSPHLERDRVALAWSNPALLGTRVAAGVRVHVEGCDVCKRLLDAQDVEQA